MNKRTTNHKKETQWNSSRNHTCWSGRLVLRIWSLPWRVGTEVESSEQKSDVICHIFLQEYHRLCWSYTVEEQGQKQEASDRYILISEKEWWCQTGKWQRRNRERLDSIFTLIKKTWKDLMLKNAYTNVLERTLKITNTVS